MKIGIIGAGNVGRHPWQALRIQNGHAVCFASRTTGNNAECAASSDVILLATPWPAAEEAIRSCGDLTGKIVVDATNPLLPTLDGLRLVGCTSSAGEQVAQWARGAKVVKALNTVGYNIMENPSFSGGRVAHVFYCGDDAAAAKKTVATLIEELGFEALDAGPLAQA